MKQYYFAENDHQLGPFTIEELKTKRIKKATLVWTDGMEDWAKAETVEELKDIIISEPPPLRKTVIPPVRETIQIKQPIVKTPISSDKYDLSFEKDTTPTAIGVILLIIYFVLYLVSDNGKIIVSDENSQALVFAILFSFIIRIIVVIWINNIAKQLNRDPIGWTIFGFFSPSLTLIIIGQLKKLKLNIVIDGSLSLSSQVYLLMENANKLLKNNRYDECLEVLNKIIELDNDNFEALKLRGISLYEKGEYDKAKIDFDYLKDKEDFKSIVNYYYGNIELKKQNIELAIKYWLKAEELGNEKAKIQLDIYYNFYGNYLLNKSEALRKLNCSTIETPIYNGRIEYRKGISQLDSNENTTKMVSEIKGFKNGVILELRKTLKTFYLAITYNEIKEINLKTKENIFEVCLIDNVIIQLHIERINDYDWFKKFCEDFHESKTKKPINIH